MGKTIYDYDAANSIDGATNWFLLQAGDNSVNYTRINRNTILGVSGQPADISTTQTFTNKTLDNSNTITVKDSLFTLQDNSDTSKQARFELSGITTGNLRSYTLPDVSTMLVGTAATQTLTNKTLTSPIITGGSITNSTISVDSIGEYTLNNGVTIDGLNIMNGKLNTNNSVVTANITDSAVTPAKLQTGTGSGWNWQSWTPTWTNLTTGNGTNTSTYTQIGKTVIANLRFTFGSTSSMGTGPTFTFPVTGTSNNLADSYVGFARLNQPGVGTFEGLVRYTNTTTGTIVAATANQTYVSEGGITSTVPFTWTTGGYIQSTLIYEAQ